MIDKYNNFYKERSASREKANPINEKNKENTNISNKLTKTKPEVTDQLSLNK